MHLSFLLLGIFCHQVMKTDYNKGHYYFIGTDMRPQPLLTNNITEDIIHKNLQKQKLLLVLQNSKISTFDKIKLLKTEQEETNQLHFSYKINFELDFE
jgi:hypothetical protein